MDCPLEALHPRLALIIEELADLSLPEEKEDGLLHELVYRFMTEGRGDFVMDQDQVILYHRMCNVARWHIAVRVGPLGTEETYDWTAIRAEPIPQVCPKA